MSLAKRRFPVAFGGFNPEFLVQFRQSVHGWSALTATVFALIVTILDGARRVLVKWHSFKRERQCTKRKRKSRKTKQVARRP